MKNKSFDCVELQHRGAVLIQEQLKGMTIQEQLEFWRKRTEELRKLQEAAQAQMAQRKKKPLP